MTNPTPYEAIGTRSRLIDGVKTKTLRLIPDERGWLMEVLRCDDPEFFQKFGQVYVSATYPGIVKAWHYHKHQIDNFACITGMVKLVLVDTRDESPTKDAVNEFFLGTQNPTLGTGPQSRVPRVEVHQHGGVNRRQRADRALPLRRPGRVPTRAAWHLALRLDPERWLMCW